MKCSLYAFTLHVLLEQASSHGRMVKPRSRNDYSHVTSKPDGKENDPNSLFDHKYPTCGRAKYENQAPGPIQSTLDQATFDVEFILTARHGGPHHLKYTCLDGQANKLMTSDKEWEYLERADDDRTDNSFQPEYPYELFIGLGEAGYAAGRVSPDKTKFKSKWKTPSKACKQGVLSWEWVTANSCVWSKMVANQPDMTAARYKEIVAPNSWLVGSTCGKKPETFYNCADVAVTFAGSSGSTTASQKGGPDEPAPEPVQPDEPAPGTDEGPDEPAPEPVQPDEPAPGTDEGPDEPAPEPAGVAGQCTDAENGQYSADPSDKNKFLRCVWGKFEHHTCQDGLVFDQSAGLCNWAWAVV